MNQSQLVKAVARATGESRNVIECLGFTLVPFPELVLPRSKRRLVRFRRGTRPISPGALVMT